MPLPFARAAALTAVLALAGAPTGLAQAPAQTLTGAAAAAAISGNTLSGRIDDENQSIFFSPDGRMAMVVDAEQTQGLWEQRGPQICLIIADEEDACYAVEVTGDTATVREYETKAYSMAITRGNTQNLPLGAPKK